MRQALAEKFLHDKTPPSAGIRTLAPVQADEAFAVAWVGSDESGDPRLRRPGLDPRRPWHDWLSKTTAAPRSTGADGHGFAFRVRARDTQATSARGTSRPRICHCRATITIGGFATGAQRRASMRPAAGDRRGRSGQRVAPRRRVGVTGGPGRPGLRLVQHRRPTARAGPRSSRVRGDGWSPGAGGRRRGWIERGTAPEHHDRRGRGLARLTFGAGGPASIGSLPGRGTRRPGVLAERRRLGGSPNAALDQPGLAFDSSHAAGGLPVERLAGVGGTAGGDLDRLGAPRPGPGTGLARRASGWPIAQVRRPARRGGKRPVAYTCAVGPARCCRPR